MPDTRLNSVRQNLFTKETPQVLSTSNGSQTIRSYYPSVIFGRQKKHEMVEKGEAVLKVWAEQTGIHPSRIPSVELDSGQLSGLLVAGYVDQTHSIHVNPDIMAKVERSPDEIFAHEGTHGVLSALRTQLKLTEPELFQRLALETIKEDTLGGDKRMLTLMTQDAETTRAKSVLMARPYIPLREDRQKIANFIEWIVKNNHYQVLNGEAQFTEKVKQKIEALCESLESFWPLYFNENDSPDKQETDAEFGGEQLGSYIKAQLYRYDMVMNHSTVLDKNFNRKNFEIPLKASERKQAIQSIKEFLLTQEANALIHFPPTYLFNLAYAEPFYFFGNYEERLAHINGYRNQLRELNQKIIQLKQEDLENELSKAKNLKDKLENNIKIMALGQRYSELVVAVNQLPRNKDVEKRRIALLNPLAFAEQALTQELNAYNADKNEDKKPPNSLKEKALAFGKLVKKYYDLSDPEVLFEVSEQRNAALQGAKKIVEEMKLLIKNSTIAIQTPFLFNSFEELEANSSKGQLEVISDFFDKHMKDQDLLYETYFKAYGGKRLFSYKAGF